MAETAANIDLGAARIYYAATGTALPTITGTLNGTVTWTGWTKYPYNSGTVTIGLTEETKEILPNGKKTPIASEVIRKGAEIKFACMESDVESLRLCLTSSGGTTTIKDGGAATAVVYRALALETDLAVYHFKKAKWSGAIELETSDESENTHEVTIMALALDTETADEQVYQIHKRT